MPRKHKQNKKENSRPMGLAIMSKFQPALNPNHIANQRLALHGTISSNVVGVITQTLNFRPDSAADWASFAALYDEFRVVAVRLSLIPYQQGTVTAINGLVAVTFDDNENGALTSVNEALDSETCRIVPSIWYGNSLRTEQISYARPSAGKNTDIPWQQTAAPATCLGSVKMYSTALSTSVVYFTYAMEYFVQFRLRR